MTCKPKIVTKVISPPREEKLECFNCGCKVSPGLCHCGAEVWWYFDPWDGWLAHGSIEEFRVAASAGETRGTD